MVLVSKYCKRSTLIYDSLKYIFVLLYVPSFKHSYQLQPNNIPTSKTSPSRTRQEFFIQINSYTNELQKCMWNLSKAMSHVPTYRAVCSGLAIRIDYSPHQSAHSRSYSCSFPAERRLGARHDVRFASRRPPGSIVSPHWICVTITLRIRLLPSM